jgi:hypothetical protein
MADAAAEEADTEAAHKEALASVSPATRRQMSRPLSPADKAKHSTGDERSGMDTPGAKKRWYSNRKNQTRVGLIIVTAIAAVVGYTLYIPFEIIHIAQVLWHHHGDRQARSEQRAEAKVWERLFTEKQTETGAYKFRTGHIISDKFHNIALKRLQARFTNAGVEEVWNGGRFVGIKDIETGAIIKNFADANILQKHLLTWETIFDHAGTKNPILLGFYTKLMRDSHGVSFKFWSKDVVKITAKDLLTKLWSKVGEGAAGDVGLDATLQGKDDKAAQAQKAKLDQSATGGLKSAGQAVLDNFNQTLDVKQAIEVGKAVFKSKAFKVGGAITGIAAFYCILQAMINADISQRTITLTDRLIRQGNMIQTMAHQAMAGDLHPDEYGLFMQRLAGDPNADPNTQESSKDFTKSASWKRAVGDPVSTDNTKPHYSNYTPDLSQDANPSPGAIGTALQVISAMFNIPGTAWICKVLNSWFGWVIQAVGLIATIFEGPIGILVAGFQAALQTFMLETIVPEILRMVTGLSVTGTEDPVGLLNNASAGTGLSMAELGRSSGDTPLTPTQLSRLNASTQTDLTQYAQRKGWTYRTFAMDNTNSLISRVLDQTPPTPQAAVASLSGSIRSLIPNLGSIFGAIAFGNHRAIAAAPAGQCEFGFACFGTDDATIDTYGDPIANEDVLAAPITKPDGTVTSRLEMLGDPKDYKPLNGPVPTTGLFYCFVNPPVSPPWPVLAPANPKDPKCLDLNIIAPNTLYQTTFQLPGPHEILDLIYCQENNVCGLPYDDDFNRYRMELKYYLHATAIYGYSTPGVDPWQ